MFLQARLVYKKSVCHFAKIRPFVRLLQIFGQMPFPVHHYNTETGYMTPSGPLDNLVLADKRREYYEIYEQWFPRKECEEHKKGFVETRCKGKIWSDEG